MVTQQAAINIAHSFVQECKTIGVTFDKVMLFGSHAKGTAHDSSDIDLLLVSKNFTDDIFANLKQYTKVHIRYPLIETHPYSFQQFMEAMSLLRTYQKRRLRFRCHPLHSS